ncbi:MAG: transaldolase [Candidatus Andersenbacteria bacterium]|nr:transaldolase [Candidatus Andersenbacteria bacterium]
MKRLTEAKLFVDTGDPAEARAVQDMLARAGYASLDGATTNPSYFAKNPGIQRRLQHGRKFSQEELLAAYRQTAQEIERIIPGGDISVEVYADAETPAEAMVVQARELNGWIAGARIKLPIIERGLLAAEQLKNELRLNMTLCFSQQQAAAVYAATKGASEPIVISPFIGRLDDRGENGTQLVGNILRMYANGDDHVKVLAASFRRVDNILAVIRLKADILTINLDRFKLWQEAGWPRPDEQWHDQFAGRDIPYEDISLDKDWRGYDLHHDLTDVGLQKFADDWNNLRR